MVKNHPLYADIFLTSPSATMANFDYATGGSYVETWGVGKETTGHSSQSALYQRGEKWFIFTIADWVAVGEHLRAGYLHQRLARFA